MKKPVEHNFYEIKYRKPTNILLTSFGWNTGMLHNSTQWR